MVQNITQPSQVTPLTIEQNKSGITSRTQNVLLDIYKNWKPIAATTALSAATLAAVYFSYTIQQDNTAIAKHTCDSQHCYLAPQKPSFYEISFGNQEMCFNTPLNDKSNATFANTTILNFMCSKEQSASLTNSTDVKIDTRSIVDNKKANYTKKEFDDLESLLKQNNVLQQDLRKLLTQLKSVLSTELV